MLVGDEEHPPALRLRSGQALRATPLKRGLRQVGGAFGVRKYIQGRFVPNAPFLGEEIGRGDGHMAGLGKTRPTNALFKVPS